jgi:hypothetical protein
MELYDLTGTTWRRLEEAFPQWKEWTGRGSWGLFRGVKRPAALGKRGDGAGWENRSCGKNKTV